MKKIIFGFLLATCFLLLTTFSFAISFPKPVGYVNDFAGLFSAGFKDNLESSLSSYEKTTGAEFAVVTIKSLDGNDIDSYASQLFENWKIGKKGLDNGLLLLISKDDKQMRIEVGYGLEPYITDARAGDVIRNVMAPEFKAGNFEKGTLEAVTQLQTYITNKDVAPTEMVNNNSPGEISGNGIVFIIAILYVFITYIAGYLGRTKEIWPGGALGAILGGIGGFIFASAVGLIIGIVIFAPLGLLFDYILTKNYKARSAKGLKTGFWNTWGGFGGGGWGGGGGGFGGFGGGGSGGGGASGGW